MKNINLVLTFCLIAIFSCKEANPIIDTPPIEEEEVLIPTDTYCVVEEEPIIYDETFYVHDTGAQEHGFATAIKLNKEWEGSAYARFHNDYFYIFLGSYAPFDPDITNVYEGRELLGFKLSVVDQGCFIGTQAIENEWSEPHAKFSYSTHVGDVAEDSYQLYSDDAKGNYLEIDSINLETNFISGYFSGGYHNSDPSPKDWNPNYVRFLNGRFECAIID